MFQHTEVIWGNQWIDRGTFPENMHTIQCYVVREEFDGNMWKGASLATFQPYMVVDSAFSLTTGRLGISFIFSF